MFVTKLLFWIFITIPVQADLEDYLTCYENFKVMTDDLFTQLSQKPEDFLHLINEAICSYEDNPEQCLIGFQLWWPQISPRIFTLEGSDLLVQTICYKFTNPGNHLRQGWQWNCDHCKYVVNDFFEFMKMEMAPYYVENMSGKDFCTSADLNLDEAQVVLCQEYIANFVPKIFQVIFNFPDGIDNDGAQICNAYTENICES